MDGRIKIIMTLIFWCAAYPAKIAFDENNEEMDAEEEEEQIEASPN